MNLAEGLRTGLCILAIAAPGLVWSVDAGGGEVPGSYVEAMAWYREQALAGNAEAQFFLGYGYETGMAFGYVPESQDPLPVDLEKARQWYAAAAAQDHARAQVRLAHILLGTGDADAETVRGLLAAAARSGEVDAMSLLGFLMLSAAPRDLPGAFRWLSAAAAAGDPPAAANLALLKDGMTPAMLEQAVSDYEAWRGEAER